MTEKFIKLSAAKNTAEVLEIPAVEDKELDNSFNEFVHHEINCDLYEAVDVGGTFKNVMMLVDESGKWRGKQVNNIAWLIYNGCNPRDHIVGDVIFCGTHRVGELQELDFCGLTDEQISEILEHVRRFRIFFGIDEAGEEKGGSDGST
jgi:hypothetical protein